MAIAIRGSNGTSSAIQNDGNDVITINDSTSVPSVVSATPATDTTQIASTAFVHDAIFLDTDYLQDFRIYDASRTYNLNEPTFHNGIPYRSLQNTNLNHSPDSSPTYWEVTGSGSGISSTPGFTFENGQFEEKQLIDWNRYNDGDVAIPVNGTAGTPNNITFTLDTTTPLIGTGSGVITKDGFSRRGEGVSYDFTADRGVLGEPSQISFVYETSTLYASGDISIYIFDITNSVLLYPSVVDLPATYGKPGNFLATLYLNSTSSSYRLIYHIASSSASSYTVKIDNVQVGERDKIVGFAGSNWLPIVGAINLFDNSSGPRTNGIGTYRMVGDSAEVLVYFASSSPALSSSLGVAYITLPNSFPAIDSTKVPSASTTYASSVGTWTISGPTQYTGQLWINTSARNIVFSHLGNVVGSNAVSLRFTVPIAQWTVNTNMVEQFVEYASNDNAGTAANTTYLDGFVYGSDGALIKNIVSNDNTLYHTTNYRVRFKNPIQLSDALTLEVKSPNTSYWTKPTPDGEARYLGSAAYGMGVSSVSNNPYEVVVYFGNAGALSTATAYGGVATAHPWTDWTNTRWRVKKVSNSNMAQIPPVVRAEYNVPGSTAFGADGTVLNFSSKIEDTHNAVTTGASWKFTAPISGIYSICWGFETQQGSFNARDWVILRLFKNNSIAPGQAAHETAATYANGYLRGNAAVDLRLIAGEYIHVTFYKLLLNAGAPTTWSPTPGLSPYIQITRIGS